MTDTEKYCMCGNRKLPNTQLLANATRRSKVAERLDEINRQVRKLTEELQKLEIERGRLLAEQVKAQSEL
jgi:tetrahydromethanopterin S-methyltransferase subunit G